MNLELSGTWPPAPEALHLALLDEFPEERAAIDILVDQLAFSQHFGRNRWTLEDVQDALQAASTLRTFIVLLDSLARYGLVKSVIHVESSAGGALGEFGSLLDIPDRLFDARLGCEVQVLLDQLSLVYVIALTADVAAAMRREYLAKRSEPVCN